MFGFVQSWFAPTGNPIGVDLGSDSLRLAQVEQVGVTAGAADFKLVAAARVDVPAHLRHDLPNRMAFFAESLRDLWASGGFRGRKAMLGLPAASMAIQHLRIARMEEEALRQALPWEARGKLPYDPSHAALRHMIAGEIHQDGEQKNEVILMAAQRELVNQLLAAAGRAKIEVVGMNVEPRAIVDCFGHVYRRKSDLGATTLYIDMGCAATRAYIARGQQILFARVVPVGSEQFTRAVSQALKIKVDEARLLRNKLAQMPSGQANSPDAERRVGDQRRRPRVRCGGRRGRGGRVGADRPPGAGAGPAGGLPPGRRGRRRLVPRAGREARRRAVALPPVPRGDLPEPARDPRDLHRRRGPPPRSVPGDRPRVATAGAGRGPDGAARPQQRGRSRLRDRREVAEPGVDRRDRPEHGPGGDGQRGPNGAAAAAAAAAAKG